MGLELEMAPYFDGNGLISNRRVEPGTIRGSDNGPLHSSRYLIIQRLINEPIDCMCLLSVLKCVDADGNLRRSPQDLEEDMPDDHYGVISMLSLLGLTQKIVLPWRCMHPALIYMRALQQGGIQGLIARLFSSLIALIIVFSNWSEDIHETSDRVLTWNLVQGTKQSWLCYLAGKLWEIRQNKLYGDFAVKKVYAIYYGVDHPLTKYVR